MHCIHGKTSQYCNIIFCNIGKIILRIVMYVIKNKNVVIPIRGKFEGFGVVNPIELSHNNM